MKAGSKKFFVIGLIGMVLLVSFMVALAAELHLRRLGYNPGSLSDDSFLKLVDSLYVRNDYEADSEGIFKVSEEKRELVDGILQGNIPMPADIYSLDIEGTIANLIRDFDTLNHPAGYGGSFGSYIQNLRKINPQDLTEVDSAYLHYAQSPINSDRFRSIEFKNYKTDKLKVLLLGDSFTWGLSATPIVYSFADQLAADNLVVYNTGIVGADPAQYLAIAEKYVPLLHPDVVIVNFFMGNDPMYFYRPVLPFKPYNHPTNFGWLMAFQDGCYLTAQQAYDRTTAELFIRTQSDSWFNKLCAKTSLGTRLWQILVKSGVVENKNPIKVPVCQEPHEKPVTEFYLDSILNVCQMNHSKMLLVLIPIKDEISNYTRPNSDFLKNAKDNFKHTKYFYPADLTENDFPDDGHHFNNMGSTKYAKFLTRLIDSLTAVQ